MNATSQMGGISPFLMPSVASVFRRIWPKHGRKHLAHAAGVSVDTAKDWLAGRSVPRVDDLFEIARRDPAARAHFMRVLGDIEYAEQRLAELSSQDVLQAGGSMGTPCAVVKPARGLDLATTSQADAAGRTA